MLECCLTFKLSLEPDFLFLNLEFLLVWNKGPCVWASCFYFYSVKQVSSAEVSIVMSYFCDTLWYLGRVRKFFSIRLLWIPKSFLLRISYTWSTITQDKHLSTYLTRWTSFQLLKYSSEFFVSTLTRPGDVPPIISSACFLFELKMTNLSAIVISSFKIGQLFLL